MPQALDNEFPTRIGMIRNTPHPAAPGFPRVRQSDQARRRAPAGGRLGARRRHRRRAARTRLFAGGTRRLLRPNGHLNMSVPVHEMKLEGIRVIDLSLFLPGPHLTMMMADHGAEVIKVEPPEGEPNRGTSARSQASSQRVLPQHPPRQARAWCVNLKDAPEARGAAEAVRDRRRHRRGLPAGRGRPARRRLPRGRGAQPAHRLCSIAAFGQTGPMARVPAHDLSIQARAGVVSLNLGRTAAGDAAHARGRHGRVADGNERRADGAAAPRQRTGQGDYLDISMQDSVVSWLVNVMGPLFAEDRDMVVPHERSFGGYAFYGIYECADGRFLTLGGSEIKFATNLLTALGRPDLIDICRLPPGPGQEPVKAFLRETFQAQPLAHWESVLAGIDVCWAPVRTLREALRSEQVRHRQMCLDFDAPQAEGGKVTELGIPIKYRLEPGRVLPDIPALGEHTQALLSAIGFDAAQIRKASGAERAAATGAGSGGAGGATAAPAAEG
jgi:crotonobetainyl-CoA:carnitine CoA-transferase CaiB-like acyl-CoA transferase